MSPCAAFASARAMTADDSSPADSLTGRMRTRRSAFCCRRPTRLTSLATCGAACAAGAISFSSRASAAAVGTPCVANGSSGASAFASGASALAAASSCANGCAALDRGAQHAPPRTQAAPVCRRPRWLRLRARCARRPSSPPAPARRCAPPARRSRCARPAGAEAARELFARPRRPRPRGPWHRARQHSPHRRPVAIRRADASRSRARQHARSAPDRVARRAARRPTLRPARCAHRNR